MSKAFQCYKLANNFLKFAAIQHPPIKIDLFLISLKKKLDAIAGEIASNVDYFNTEDGGYYLYDYIKISKNELNYIKNETERILKRNAWSISYFIDFYEKNISWYDVLQNLIQYLKESILEIKNLKKIFKGGLERFDEEYLKEYFSDSYGNYKKDDYHKILKILTLMEEVILIMSQSKIKLDILFKNFHMPSNKSPETENIEILYHTTINADTIMNEGFKKNWEPSTLGLGGSTLDKEGNSSVSFTSNLYVAKEIYRCLKEAVMIANGEVDWHDIVEWSQKAGIYDDVDKAYNGIYGKTNASEADEKDVFNLYKIYLAYAKYGKRYDPLFMSNIVDKLKSKSQKDVGILVAEVDMTDKAIDYAKSMDEYRVPVRAIKKIIKVIR